MFTSIVDSFTNSPKGQNYMSTLFKTISVYNLTMSYNEHVLIITSPNRRGTHNPQNKIIA